MLLTDDQHHLLAKINQYSETNRRTDRLATCMTSNYGVKWDASHTAFIAVQLRALGCVTSTKDAGAYALWNITATGKAALLQSSAERDKCKPQREAPVTVPDKVEYLVLPKNKNATALRFGNEEEAIHKAKYLADLAGYDYEIVQTQVVATIKYTPATAAKVEVTKP